jgi:hypothetical protein
MHLQAGLELVELEEVDHEEEQHNKVDEEDIAHDLGVNGWGTRGAFVMRNSVNRRENTDHEDVLITQW